MRRGPEAPAAAVLLRGISKRFGAVQANRNVTLEVARGAIHGIVGENGAGKSTLMSILYGFYRADEGEILIDGRPVEIHSSRDAIAAGIGMVHQHFMLVDSFSVIENVMLGAEGGFALAGGRRTARRELARLADEFGLAVHPDALIADLPVGELQRVEILKALYRGAEILILDEPTGVLTPQETEQLFRILGELRARGVTILLITHKLREIMAITDRVTVMRAGEVVAERVTAETDETELAELMVGRKVRLTLDRQPAQPGAEILSLDGVTVRDRHGIARIDGVSFALRAGEILGIAGVAGNGQSELLELLSGIRPPDEGRMRVLDREVTRDSACDPREMRRLGVAHVPEDRHRLGLVMAFPAWESAVLGYQDDRAYMRGPFCDHDAMIDACERMMATYDVRPRQPMLGSSKFSGGNQQKLILARELGREPKLLLIGQPTRGVDIGAIEFIHRQILAMRDRGAGILMVSTELDEILSLSDRILVMFEGRVVGIVDGASADERTLGLMMANAATLSGNTLS